MKRSQQDELIQLAFGELKKDRADQLRAKMSADESAFVMDFEEIRKDLKRLPVPEHQLSTERLRDAILSQGLHPKRQAPLWLRFAWVPAAAVAAIAFAQVMSLGQGHTPNAAQEPVAMSVSPADETTGAHLDSAVDAVRTGIDGILRPAESGQPAMSMASSAKTIRRSARNESVRNLTSRGSSETSTVEPSASTALLMANAITAAAPVETGESDAMPATFAAPATTQEKPGVIMIGTEKDAVTGANKASEVTSTGNVGISG
jgi:hypothetical protein